MFLKSLSGRFLLLTVLFVMLAEVLIFVPSVARFRVDYLQERLARSQIASLSLLATPNDLIGPELSTELLRNADVLNIVLRRSQTRELILASETQAMVDASFDLRAATPVSMISDAFSAMFRSDNRVIHIIGVPVKGAGLLIEVTMNEPPLRVAIWDYGMRILTLSAIISFITACLLFAAVRQFMVYPMEHLVRQIRNYRDAQGDEREIIKPKSAVTELFEAESALESMQTQLSQSLRQKERLAALGGAVSKISHDLRNILTTTQLLADRMEQSDDPAVQKSAHRLMSSLSRAVNLCESTLAFGKAQEALPSLCAVSMDQLFDDVVEEETLALGNQPPENPAQNTISATPPGTDSRSRAGGASGAVGAGSDADSSNGAGGAGGAIGAGSATRPDTASGNGQNTVRIFAVPTHGVKMMADQGQIHRVVSNLVRNARQVLSARNGGAITLEGAQEADGWSITVRDTGPGLAPAILGTLFEPFGSSARKDGYGLGLSISADLVNGHGGTLELIENSQNGATFRIWLPKDT